MCFSTKISPAQAYRVNSDDRVRWSGCFPSLTLKSRSIKSNTSCTKKTELLKKNYHMIVSDPTKSIVSTLSPLTLPVSVRPTVWLQPHVTCTRGCATRPSTSVGDVLFTLSPWPSYSIQAHSRRISRQRHQSRLYDQSDILQKQGKRKGTCTFKIGRSISPRGAGNLLIGHESPPHFMLE